MFKVRKKTARRLVVAGVLVLSVVAAVLLCRLFSKPLKESNLGVDGSVTCGSSVGVVATANVLSTGDLLMHSPVVAASYDENSKSYNFEKIFTYLSPYTGRSDYCVINMEGTLAAGGFSGYPTFKCPDSLIDSAKAAGFDMFLTANNHSNDGGESGFRRTAEVLRSKNVDFIGTRINDDDKKYIVKDINGIKVGMVNYTYGEISDTGIVSVNGIPSSSQNSKLINVFDYNKLDSFYSEQKKIIAEMKNDGAEKIIYYMHWGAEYQLKESKIQKNMAEKLADLGVDVIVGGHPHVVQPMDVIHSNVSGKDTVCIYSVGNAVSNQRRERMNLKTGHTEDGVLFLVSFAKYSDGNVVTSGVDVIPTWVNFYTGKNGKNVYQIVPLDRDADWKSSFGLNTVPNGFEFANKSYERTMKLVSGGLKKAKDVIMENINKLYPKIEKLKAS